MEHEDSVPWMQKNSIRFRTPSKQNAAENIDEYGVDWEAYQNTQIQEHHAAANPTDPFPQNPFVAHTPESLSTVEVEESRCPFSDEDLVVFQQNLMLLPEAILISRDMVDQKQVWHWALSLCREILA